MEAHPKFPNGKKIGPFRVDKYIASGGYGDIYMVSSQESRATKPNPTFFAMKVEYNDAENQGLQDEISVMLRLQGTPYLPNIIAHGKKNNFIFLTMELLGPSISRMRRMLPKEYYTLYSFLHISLEMLKCIQELHNRGFIHRDIKPGNFLIRPSRKNPIVLVDFGLSQSYMIGNSHIPFQTSVGFTGTCRYASLNAHAENELSRRDDLISWFYSTIEIATGTVPWPGSDDKELTKRIKMRISPKDLCNGLPKEYITIWEIISKLQFEETPPYTEIKNLIYKAMKHACFTCHMYDWEFLTRQQITEISFVPIDMGEPGFELSEEYQNIEEKEPSCGCSII